MSLDEFREASKSYARKALLASGWPFAGMLLFIFVWEAVQERIKAVLVPTFSPAQADAFARAPTGVAVIAMIVSLFLLGRRTERRYGIACPNCGKALAALKHIVIASRNCPHCGARVIEK
jgi:hypothetical protein